MAEVQIGIPSPTSADMAYNHRCAPEYATAVRAVGGEVVEFVPGMDSAAQHARIASCDGYLLPGSPADVDPALYGGIREPATAAADPAREALDVAVLEHAAATGKPVLAICFGLQRLNVWRGGTLVQDLQPVPVNHAAGASVAVAHTVAVAQQSLLAALLSATEAPADGGFRLLPVNSSHHQAIAIPGDDLTVVARSREDGVIEAIEGRIGQAAMLAVQWHPERSTALSAASRALFSWLVAEAEDYQLSQAPDADAL